MCGYVGKGGGRRGGKGEGKGREGEKGRQRGGEKKTYITLDMMASYRQGPTLPLRGHFH